MTNLNLWWVIFVLCKVVVEKGLQNNNPENRNTITEKILITDATARCQFYKGAPTVKDLAHVLDVQHFKSKLFDKSATPNVTILSSKILLFHTFTFRYLIFDIFLNMCSIVTVNNVNVHFYGVGSYCICNPCSELSTFYIHSRFVQHN